VLNDLKVIIRSLVYFNKDLVSDGVRLQALCDSLITCGQVIGQFHRVERKLALVASGRAL